MQSCWLFPDFEKDKGPVTVNTYDKQPLLRCAILGRSDRGILLRVLECRQLEVIGYVELSLVVTLQWQKINNKRIFNCEDGVIFQIFVSCIEYLSDKWLVARCRELPSLVSKVNDDSLRLRHTIKWM